MRHFKNLLLILTSLTLASCGKECINHIDANHDGKCDVCETEVPVNHIDADNNGICDVCEKEIKHLDSDDNNICDICGADLSKEIKIGEVTESKTWNQDLRDHIGYVLGKDNDKLVPAVPVQKGYSTYLEEIPYEDGSGSQIACVIKCFGFNKETIAKEYEEVLVNKGFYLGYSSDYGYKRLSETADLIVQYGYVYDRHSEYFELIVYKAETRVKEWPQDKIFTLIGANIPVYECDSYEFYFYLDSYTYEPIVEIYDHNVGSEGLVNYHNQIMGSGEYTLVSNTADGYTYLSNDGKINLGIYPTSDEYNLDSIYIKISNNWPYFYTTQMLGEDIPCFNINTMEYMFQDIDEDGSAEYLTIFYDGASLENFQSHCSQFVAAGWAIDEAQSSETYKVFNKTVDNIKRTIEVVYSSAQSAICVAFKD